MTLPVPRLDDRTFQDIVDEAKGRLHRLAPDWSDHNVSDPGVALIELYAWMTEMMLYRMNQVPDRLYLKLLELMGIQLHGSTAAGTDLLFRLTGPQEAPVRVPAGTQVASEHVGDAEPVVFQTTEDLVVTPPVLTACLTRTDNRFSDWTEQLADRDSPVECFPSITPGDAIYFGFSQPLGANLVRFHVVTGTEGAGINPDNPPLRWQSWDGKEWSDSVVVEDNTLAFNVEEGGDLILLLAPRHMPLAIGQSRACWVRCRLMPTAEGEPKYLKSPVLHSVDVASLGGAASAIHADTAPEEFLGTSTGEPSQVFAVKRSPVLPRAAHETVVVRFEEPGLGAGVEQRWREVAHFGDAGEDDTVYVWDSASGEIRFGPQTRLPNGLIRQHGAVPPPDSRISVTGYRHGGGRRGNVAAGRLTVLRTSIPFVASVTNLRPATSGVDAETVENARVRGPLSLRTGDRAVTAEDFERLAHEASPAVGRARCLPTQADGTVVRLLVVPRAQESPRALSLEHLALRDPLLTELTAYLDARRLLTCRVQIAEPRYQRVMVVAQVKAVLGMRAEGVREAAADALYEFLDPLRGGIAKRGWPFGQTLTDADVHGVLRSVAGVASVNRVYFFLTNARTGAVESSELQRITLPVDALLLSHRHQVVVED